MRQFDTGATRDTDEGKLHFKGVLSPLALNRFATYMEKHRIQADGSVRDPDNWKKGIPLDTYMDSLLRHVFELWADWETKKFLPDEVLCAIFFNIQGLLHESEKLKREPLPVIQPPAPIQRHTDIRAGNPVITGKGTLEDEL